jgi:hypothetical protein
MIVIGGMMIVTTDVAGAAMTAITVMMTDLASADLTTAAIGSIL